MPDVRLGAGTEDRSRDILHVHKLGSVSVGILQKTRFRFGNRHNTMYCCGWSMVTSVFCPLSLTQRLGS